MSEKEKNEQLNEVSDKVKSVIEKGNARHIIIRDELGGKIAEFSLTVAAVGALFLFFVPFAWFIVIAAVIYGIVKKVRIEVVNEISDDDDSIQMDLD